MNNPPQKRAFALVLVLIIIVLAATMAVFFLASAGQERRGVDLYARGSQVRHLAGMTVNRVMGQISAATKEGTAAAPVSWASQPGMVRTFAATGTSAVNFYKLYSWDTSPVTSGTFNAAAATENPPAGWKNSPAVFSDLNQPINDVYPIVDPRAAGTVEGFSVDAANPAVSGSGSDAPMPVKWLYVLQDGQMVAPSGSGGTTATVSGASVTNPIVGRVAFWTDDETSKVNVNTASEGAFWDWPKSASRDEMQFAANPPVKNEFQRTPGHPAMTSLSAVFPELMTETTSDSTQTRWANANYRSQLESISTLTPRVVGGGSQGGTAPINSYSMDYSVATLPTIPGSIAPDSDRLFATSDDFWFTPSRAFQSAFVTAAAPLSVDTFRQRLFFLTANSRAPETTRFETPRISLWPVTWPWPSAHYSLLKDLSTFRGRNYPSGPPASVSPTSAIEQNPWMTAQERLLAFCSTLNILSPTPARYYFQRQNPDSPTHDWNNIARNRDLVEYLRRTLDRDEPGLGGSLAGRWGTRDADWISLNAFDFSRSLINQVTMESIPTKPVTAGVNELGYSYTGLSSRDIWINGTRRSGYNEPNSYTVSPLRATLNGQQYVTQGTYPKLSEVAVMFYATDRVLPIPPSPVPATPDPPARAVSPAAENDYYNPFNWQNLINPGPAFGGSAHYPVGSRTTQMRAVMLFNFTGLTTGVLSGSPFFWIKVRGGDFQVNGSDIGLVSPIGRSVQWTGWAVSSSINPNFWPLFDKNRTMPKIFDNSSSGANRWSLISNPIAVDPTAVEFSFEGEPVAIEIYAPYSGNLDADPTGDPGQLVCIQEIDFSQWDTQPGQLLPIPIAPRWNVRDGVADAVVSAKSKNRPDPAVTNFATPESRSLTWAYTEIAPNIANPVMPLVPETLRDSIATANTRTIPYAFTSNSGPVSPIFENRVRSLNGRNTAVFKAENNPATDLTLATVDTPFMEGVPLITPFDTVISMVPDPTGFGNGDPRLAGAANTAFRRIDQVLAGVQPALVFSATATTPGGRAYPRATARAQYHQLGSPGASGPMSTGYRQNQLTFGPSSTPMAQSGRLIYTANDPIGKLGYKGPTHTVDSIVGGAFSPKNNVDANWDWTMMAGNRMDGGFVVRPDQDYQTLFLDYSDNAFIGTPYFLRYNSYGAPGSSYFSPNRQVASPVLLGTLPSSMDVGWQTLAFSPNPAAGNSHPGLDNPPDHLLLDLFWMPVAEPYPISEQFSTAGKVNLNYGIMPFSYIERKTALYAALKSTWVHALADAAATDYKSHFHFRQGSPRTRFPVDIEQTLLDFDEKFDAGDVFRSASQICEMFLVPGGESLASTKGTYWNSKRLTADNGREQPYDHLYSRVTTKSNTFTVHWRVQALRKLPSGTAGVWDESKDKMASELRGATMIERFIDPNATDIPDYATDANAEPLGKFYKWRVLSETFFQP